MIGDSGRRLQVHIQVRVWIYQDLTLCLCKGSSKEVVQSDWVLAVNLTEQRDLCV